MGRSSLRKGLLKMPISASLKATANVKLDDLVTQLSMLQATYKAKNGKYWQGLPCTATIPADGVAVTVNKTVRPSDQPESWNNLYKNDATPPQDVGIALDATLPVQLRVDTYARPNEAGYVVVGEVIESTRTYQRCINVGPDTYRSYDWTDVTST